MAMCMLSLAGGRALALPPATSDPWHRIDSRHFVVLGNAGPGRLAAVAENLERLVEVLGQTTSGLKVAPRLPTYVYVFKDPDSFAPYRPRHDGTSQAVHGYFMGTTEANYIVIGTGRGEALGVANHEYLHCVMNASLPDVPLWLTEGMAEFYSTFRTTRASAEIGRAVPEHLAWLARERLVPLERVMATGVESPDYNEAERQGTFYAESWALTHYLVHGTDDPRRFGEFLTRLGRGEPPQPAFQRALGVRRADDLLDELEAYLASPRMSYRRVDFSREFEPLEARATPMSPGATLLRLGDLLARHAEGQDAAAAEHLSGAARLDPGDAESRALLGALAEGRGDLAKAGEWYASAFALNPRSGRPHYVAGRARLERFFRDGVVERLPDTPPPELLEARRFLERSLELEPNRPEALADLGKTYVMERDPPVEGTAALLDAAAALPQRTDILLDLVLVYAHAHRVEAARQILKQHLQHRGKPLEVRAAAMAVVAAEIAVARNLATEGRLAAADSLLARAIEGAAHPDARRAAEAAREPLAAHARREGAIELYNRGVSAANGGDLAEALAWFQRARDQADDDALRREVAARVRETGHRIRVEEGLGLVRRGRLAEAGRVFEAVLRDEPDAATRKVVEGYLRDIRAASGGGR